MSPLIPDDRDLLAAAVADTLVVYADPGARRSGLYYWEIARPWTEAVASWFRHATDTELHSLGNALLAAPDDPARHAALRMALADGGRPLDAVAPLFALAWEAECNSRVGYHLGHAYSQREIPVTAEHLACLPSLEGLPAGQAADVLIVVPFRDRDTGGKRLRNLLACLLGLRDQSFPRDAYRVTVVESDEVPRWRGMIEPFADHYLFAEKAGSFNKSWAVNAGVTNSPGKAQVICILDADVLVDRDFISRNVARFRSPGTGGHLTYRNMLCLDEASTSWAIRERVCRKAPEADGSQLRGFLLRRPPGCCLWVRAGTFLRIGGMDERYEGWGGEDNDFAYRFDIAAPLDSYDDALLHMTHPPASALQDDGELVNAHIPALSWRPQEPIGQLDRFAAAAAVTGG